MARSLNKVTLIGNLTRDPELRYTPQGTAVCTIGLATNRDWKTDSGEKKEDVEFHRLVAWNKLAELCAKLLTKGRKIYVEGRLQTRKWKGQDEVERSTTEIVMSEMLLLDSKGGSDDSQMDDSFDVPDEALSGDPLGGLDEADAKPAKSTKPNAKADQSADEDIPF